MNEESKHDMQFPYKEDDFMTEKYDLVRVHFNSSDFKNIDQEDNERMLTKSSIDDKILMKIQNKIGDRCIGSGYVKKESIEIVSRSSFEIPNEDLKVGYVTNVNFKYTLINPTIGSVIESRVISSNKLGTLCHPTRDFPFLILVPDDTNNDDKPVKENTEINVEVIAKKFEQHDEKITVIGRMV